MDENDGTSETLYAEDGSKRTADMRMRAMVLLRVRGHPSVYRLLTRLNALQSGEEVLVETRVREEKGRVIQVLPVDAPEPILSGPILRVVRRLRPQDHALFLQRDENEQRGKTLCRKTIRELGLSMRLSLVSYRLDGSKAIFYFTAENRVDFRELVRILAAELQVRVEMRQIGVRDEARLLGGVGICGLEVCCSSFLQEFRPVSVRMAKSQELSLNPESISGLCGRLLCCLSFEDANYQEMRAALPKPGSYLYLKDGRKIVVKEVSPLRERLMAKLEDGSLLEVAVGETLTSAPVVVVPQVAATEESNSSLEKKDQEDSAISLSTVDVSVEPNPVVGNAPKMVSPTATGQPGPRTTQQPRRRPFRRGSQTPVVDK